MTAIDIHDCLEEYFKKKIKKINLRTKTCTGVVTELIRFLGNYSKSAILLIRIDTALSDEINIQLLDADGLSRNYTLNSGKCFIPGYEISLQNIELNKSYQITYYQVIFEN